jgi:hypothetical protein
MAKLEQTTPERRRLAAAMLEKVRKDPKLKRKLDAAVRGLQERVLTEAILINGPDAKPDEISAAAADAIALVAGRAFPKHLVPFTRKGPTSQANGWEIRELEVAMRETGGDIDQALQKPFTTPICVEEALVRMRLYGMIRCRRLGQDGGKDESG